MRVLNGLLFFPRGGSSHVTRALSAQLPAHGWDVSVLSGSLPGGLGDAERFYDDLEVHAVDLRGEIVATYEDSRDERCFAGIDDAEYEQLVELWSDALLSAGAAEADVLMLHHLTPINEAAARVAPDVPVVGALHGTELIFLERADAGPWRERARRWADRCSRLLVQTHANVERASELLDIERARFTVLPNGFDPELFQPAPAEPLFDDDRVVLLTVGRFTAVKRHGELIRAFARAQQRARRRAALVLVGGYPGETEGEHPRDAIAASGARDVVLAGWHDHSELPAFFNAADAQVLYSAREQFGLVLVEGMACGLPPLAVDRLGPAEIIDHGQTGWLVAPDDLDALVDALVEVIDDGEERARRGLAARRVARERWAWPAVAERLASVLDGAVEQGCEAGEPETGLSASHPGS